MIYDFLLHILGVPGKHSGVGMHIGHYASHYRLTTGCTITNHQMRRLLHTGIAMWLKGVSPKALRPCCDVQLVGGDGTFIGLPTQNIPKSVHPVWRPRFLRTATTDWNRRSRQPLAQAFTNCKVEPKDADDFLEKWRQGLLKGSTDLSKRLLAAVIKQPGDLSRVCPELYAEYYRWLLMPSRSREHTPLKMILSCLFEDESLTGVFPEQLCSSILENKLFLLRKGDCKQVVERLSTEFAFRGCGVGPEIIALFSAQIHTHGSLNASTVNLILYFASEAKSMHQIASRCDNDTKTSDNDDNDDAWCERPDPAASGIRYFVTEHGRSQKNSWPLTATEISKFNIETSCTGCTKKRPVYIGHRQRTGIWINLCMIHELVIGFHLIHNQEGRRDALVPIYRFWEKPPIAVWNDFGCGCEESGLNWLPEFFHGVQHFHDMFHGNSHTSCSKKFFSRRLPAFSSLNTSLMEQVLHCKCFVLSLI